jgi:hypothetical protein
MSYAQVITRHLGDKEKLENFIYFPLEKDLSLYMQPEINFERVLEEDRRSGYPLHRVAVKVDKNYTVSDGKWAKYGDIMVWQIGFSAPTARSLNFLINDLVLPIDAEMFIYSNDGKIIQGPITSNEVYDKVFASDIIESTEVLIAVRTNILRQKGFSIKIQGVCQGVRRQSTLREWQDAGDCNLDVNCPVGAIWQHERDAVARMIINGQGSCSGSLINNQCQDMRSFFLSAFHCLDSDGNGQLSLAEQNLNNYSFRFKYEAGTPTCPGNSTGTQGIWITYSGAIFRSGNSLSDFGLIELNGSIINQPNIAVAGWNRNVIAASSGVGIHHPSGDEKKISLFNSTLVREDNPFRCGLPTGPGTQKWVVFWNSGITERGSSGSPLFDQNRRIVGQLAGGPAGCNQQQNCQFDSYGRFDNSWTGGGTNGTRLSNWLAGSNPPITTNTIRSPWINPWVESNKQEYVCTTNKVFTLNNPIPGKTVTWSVNNTSLFATTGGAATSGSGTSATLRANPSGVIGSATLTFSLTESGCNTVNVIRHIWVGRPSLPLTSPSGSIPIDIGVTDYHTVFLSTAPGAPYFEADWAAIGAVTKQSINSPTLAATYVGSYVGTGNWAVTTTNICGSQSNFGQYNVTANCNPCPKIVLNNPVRDMIYAKIPDYNLPTGGNTNGQDMKGDFILMDQQGIVVKKETFIGKEHTTDVSTIKSGIFFVRMKNKDIDLIEKIVIIR